MPGVFRKDLVGLMPFVEYRQSHYFVCFPQVKAELVMAFEDKITAREIGANVCAGTPFYTMIPVVPYRTEYPRPWLVYPPVRIIRDQIDLRIVDTSTSSR